MIGMNAFACRKTHNRIGKTARMKKSVETVLRNMRYFI